MLRVLHPVRTAMTELAYSFPSSQQAWTFMRAVDAERIAAGFPSLGTPWTVRTIPCSPDDTRILDLEADRSGGSR